MAMDAYLERNAIQHIIDGSTLALAHMCASGVSWLNPRPPRACMARSTTLLAICGATILIIAISALAAYQVGRGRRREEKEVGE